MTLAGFKSSNHPQQISRRGAVDATDDRRTPSEIFNPLNDMHDFTLDVAASADNAKCRHFLTLERNGLWQSWQGHRVWCNPPYSDCRSWVEKAWSEMREGGCEIIVMLLPANRTEQAWWQTWVEPFRDSPTGSIRLSTTFLRGRPRFIRPNWTKPAKGDRPPFGLVILKWQRGVA